MNDPLKEEEIKAAVRQTYGDLARRFVEEPVSPCGCCGPRSSGISTSAGCCGPTEAAVETGAAARLYSPAELAGLPASVTGASAGCGNPTAIAELRPGEVVLDLGSGGGIDCFLAAKQVGPTGRVIGLDMTPEMIRLARRNAKKIGATNVEFQYGEMEEMPLPDATVDVIISNCVINLSPDKDAVFAEAYRVLRPGGRVSISDIVLTDELPPQVRRRLDAWAGCIAGALTEADYLSKIRAAGFVGVEVESRVSMDTLIPEEEARQTVEGEEMQALLASTGLSAHDLARKIVSIRVKAYKPA